MKEYHLAYCSEHTQSKEPQVCALNKDLEFGFFMSHVIPLAILLFWGESSVSLWMEKMGVGIYL